MNENDYIRLIYEILVGMRNAPVHRATKMLAEHGYVVPVDDHLVSYQVMREQRDDAREANKRLHEEIERLTMELRASKVARLA